MSYYLRLNHLECLLKRINPLLDELSRECIRCGCVEEEQMTWSYSDLFEYLQQEEAHLVRFPLKWSTSCFHYSCPAENVIVPLWKNGSVIWMSDSIVSHNVVTWGSVWVVGRWRQRFAIGKAIVNIVVVYHNNMLQSEPVLDEMSLDGLACYQ